MNILLTRPLNQTPMLIPNIGIGYLATALRNIQQNVSVIDCIKEAITPKLFREFVTQNAFQIIAFQVYTFDLSVLQPYIDVIRNVQSECIILCGGPHPTAEPESMLQEFPEVDALLRGEAEIGFPQLCLELEKLTGPPINRSLLQRINSENVAGLVLRNGDGKIKQSALDYVSDLDATGFPAWDLIDPRTYPPAPQGTFTKRLPVAPIIVTRGCPFDCTFCAGHLISGKKIRTRSASNVVDEIEYLVSNYGIREIHIEDDNFTLNRKLVKTLCHLIIERDLDITWACPNGLRLDSLDAELIQLMEKAGCYSIAIGIESGSQRIVDIMKKKLDLTAVQRKIALIRENSSIKITGFFMIGYPGETLEEMKKTITFSLELDLDKVNFGAFMPLPGTDAYLELKNEGKLGSLDFSRITEYRVPFAADGISPAQVRRLLQYAFLRFYMRPRIVVRFLREIHSPHQIKVLAKRFLEVFWR